MLFKKNNTKDDEADTDSTEERNVQKNSKDFDDDDDDDDQDVCCPENQDQFEVLTLAECEISESDSLLSFRSLSSPSFRHYLMALFISCLMTFLISLFIISLSLMWILGNPADTIANDYYQTNNEKIINSNDSFDLNRQTKDDDELNLLRSTKSLLLLNNKRQHGVGHIFSINLIREQEKKLSGDDIDNLKGKRQQHHYYKKLRRNSTRHLSSSRKLNEILSENYPMNRLLNLNDFKFVHQNSFRCQEAFRSSSPKTEHDQLNLVIVVHSAIGNFNNRQLIRRTWGKIRSLAMPNSNDYAQITYVMVVGQTKNSKIQNEIDKEFQQYGDLVQTNVLDTYNNLTYKHLAALRWSVESCPQAQFILKLDDDAYLNLFAVIESLFNYQNYFQQYQKESSTTGRNLLACSLFPERTKPKRHGKWRLTYDQYPHDWFPQYCSGVGYLLTPDVAFDLFEAAHNVQSKQFNPRFIPIDDLFVTGLVVKNLSDLKPVPLNQLYVYDVRRLRRWLRKTQKEICPMNIWIGDIGNEPDWQTLAEKLWNKTKRAWKNYSRNLDICN